MSQQLSAAIAALAAAEPADRDRLAELVGIASVSSDPGRRADLEASVHWVAEELRRLSFTDVTVHPVPAAGIAPALTARLDSPVPGAPTVLVYGHVDVQPVEPLALWDSAPYEVHERDGKLFGRGVTDDKGQLLMYLRAVEAAQQAGLDIPVNLLVLVDAEEEIGSPGLATVLADNPWLGTAGVALVSDSPMFGVNQPAVGYSLRGLVYVEATVTGLSGDLHSGQFGGAVPNAAAVAAELVAGLHDESGRVTVDGFYDEVLELTAQERDRLAALPFQEGAWLSEIGAAEPVGERGFTSLERTWARPTLELNGITGGHGGPGPKTIVPATATVKLSARLVPHQDPVRIAELVVAHLEKHAPSSVSIDCWYGISSKPVLTPADHATVAAAQQALTRTWNEPTSLIRDGGTIPAVALLQEAFGMPTVLLGFGVPNENKHAPNEWLPVDHFRLAPQAILRLLLALPEALREPGIPSEN